MMINKKTILFLLMYTFSNYANSVNLLIEDSQLIGADGISFDGLFFSVRFKEGTCAEIFNGCDDKSDLLFQSLTSTNIEAKDLAIAANTALLEQVFDSYQLYDDNATLTFGCEAGTNEALNRCGIHTPAYTFNETVSVSGLTNYDNPSQKDIVTWGGGLSISGYSTIPLDPNAPDRHVYAVWNVAMVPLPMTSVLFISGILTYGFIGFNRKH